MCRVSDHFLNYVFSEWVKVKVLDISKSGKSFLQGTSENCLFENGKFVKNFCFFSGLPVDWQGNPHIAINPKPQTIQRGSKLTLLCAAFGIPAPHYQWYKNGQPLLDKTSDTLQVGNDANTLQPWLILHLDWY